MVVVDLRGCAAALWHLSLAFLVFAVGVAGQLVDKDLTDPRDIAGAEAWLRGEGGG